MTKNRKKSVMAVAEKESGGEWQVLFVLIFCCFFFSGMTGLIYEILWTRMITKIIGNAPFAVSIVLSVFMAGLGIGGYVGGKFIDRTKNHLRLVTVYGILEITIAVYGLLLPLFLLFLKPLQSFLYNRLFEYFLYYNVLTIVGCAFIILIPAVCMGATLPVLSRFFIINLSHVGTRLGHLYGLNTMGAACGSILCGFLLIRHLGTWGTMGVAAAFNMIIGLFCILSARYLFSRKNRSHGREEENQDQSTYHEKDLFHAAALSIIAVSGFCTMAYEVIWTKLIGLIVGPTTYSFTIVLTTFIAGLAIGSFFFGRVSDRIKKSNVIHMLIATQIIAALSALAISQVLGNSQIFFAKLIFSVRDHFTHLLMIKAVILFLFMIIPTFFMGAAFPLTGKICTHTLRQTGRHIGFIYAVNTVGAVAGSFCAGFLLIPLMGKERGLELVISVQLFTSLIFIGYIQWKKRRGTGKWALSALLILLGLCTSLFYSSWSPWPHWNRKMLASGKYHRYQEIKDKKVGWIEALFSGMDIFSGFEKDKLVFFGDGIGGFTTVWQSATNVLGHSYYTMLNNGKADASSSKSDMCTQTVSAHFPLIFHPEPKDVLVIGLGSGITAGEVLHYPVDSLDVVEISEQVVKASRFFNPWNNGVLLNPKTDLVIQDGRAHLALSDRKYDVIISEPSNPWMAGLASLFTREYMQLAKNRLKKGGVYVQWFHSYQMNWPMFAMVGRTFSTVFPNSLLLTTNPGKIGPDFLLIGFKEEAEMDMDIAQKNVEYAKKSKNMTLYNPDILVHLIISEDLQKLFQKGPINTDDRPYLEFAAPELMHVHVRDSKIGERLQANSWLSKQSLEVVESYAGNIEKQIDYAAYILSFHTYEMNQIDLTFASKVQKGRLARSLKTYCSEYIVSDFSFIGDEELQKSCINAAMDAAYQYLETGENKADTYAYMGWLCYEDKKTGLAVDYFLKALQIAPYDDSVSLTLKQILAAFTYDDAATKVMSALRHSPENYAFNYQMGVLSEKQGDMNGAKIHYQKALSIRPDFIQVLNNMGFIHMKETKYKESISFFKKIIEVQPTYTSAYYNIACMYSIQNKSDKALSYFEKALRRDFNNWNHIMSDADLENIRGTARFKQLKEQYSGG